MIPALTSFDMRPEITLTTTNESTLVTISGDLTIRYAKEISEIFKTITGKNISIELCEPTAMDLSFLQILVAYVNVTAQKGGSISVKKSLREAEAQLLTNTGFSVLL
jgi:anti-anti-sigma regulatory factor